MDEESTVSKFGKGLLDSDYDRWHNTYGKESFYVKRLL